jgi:hypothetical protein
MQDDGAYPDMTPRVPKEQAMALHGPYAHQDSYHFTASGTIWLEGFAAKIG